MKKQFKKIALAVIFSMVAALFAPANHVAQAASKTFTYAEQITGDKVTTLVMDKGEKIDLKFIGVSNWKTYSYKWASSNTKVAVVDSSGLITAVGSGVATIKLKISGGDGTEYTSTGVTVYVGQKQEVTIGTAATEEIKSYVVEMGKSVVLKANGIADNVGDRYTFNWSSTDTSVAKISSNGVITTVAPGLTVIQLSVTKKFSGEVLTATPIALQVTAKGATTVTSTPTPKPTTGATVTATPTPSPAATNGSYTVAVTSDRTITLTFKNRVAYTVNDVTLSQVLDADDDILIKMDLESAELDSTGKIMTITTQDVLETDTYNVKVGTADNGVTFPVTIGDPNKLVLSYSCLGKDGIAYVYDEEVGLDVPVILSYKLYYDDIDVTESYANEGYVYYDLVSPTDSEYVMLSGEQLYFYSNRVSAAIQATYTYYNSNGVEKELKASASIRAQVLGAYSITKIVNWTIIDNESTAAIDWDNPVRSVVADTYNHKIVVLFADSYGYYYSTDSRGVNKAKNIYSADDPETLFAMQGYSYTLSPSNDTNYFIDNSGILYTYEADSRASAIFTLQNYDAWTSGEKKLGGCQFTILAKSKLNSIVPESTSVTLLTQAENNEDRFCTVDVPLNITDQYKEEWKGDSYFTVTSSSSLLNNYIGNVASVQKLDGKYVLHIDAREMVSAGVSTTATFYVTDTETNKKSTGIRVTLKNPAASDGTIAISTWDIGMKQSVISYGEGKENEVAAQAEVEIYQISKNGSYKVGLLTTGTYDENNNRIYVQLQPSATYSFPAGECEAGDIYVAVIGPDGKMLGEGSSMELGVYVDGDGKIKITVTGSSSVLTALTAGKYTVRVTKINKISGNYVSKVTKSTTFTVEDKTKNVELVGYNNNKRTDKSVYGATDPTLKEVVAELFVFNLGGAKWTNLTADMINEVNCVPMAVDGAYRITSVEFIIPADGDSTIKYTKTVTINQTIYTNPN